MKRLLFITIINLIIGTQLKAQWIVSPGSSGGSKNIYRINAIDANVVWAIDEDNLVYRTINGGSSWNRFYLNNKFPGNSIISFTGFDANTAWATIQNLSNWPYLAEIHKTTDGGNTWVHQTTAYTSNFHVWPNFVHFFDANNGVTVGDADGSFFEIYTTSNGGTTWVKVPASSLPPAFIGKDYTTANNKYTAIGNTIWFGAGGMRIFKSEDKGLTWTVSNTNIPQQGIEEIVSNIAFTDANNGIVSAIDTFLRTTDGGITWVPFTPTGPYHTRTITRIPGVIGGYVSVNRAANSIANGLGSSYSLDHGATWISIETSLSHKTVAFSSPTLGWAGDFGFLRKYNGGILSTPKELLLVSDFNISPNPGTGIFTINTTSNKLFSLEVFDLTGRKIMQQSSGFGQNVIDLLGQKKGLYLVHILSGEQRIIEKIVLQ